MSLKNEMRKRGRKKSFYNPGSSAEARELEEIRRAREEIQRSRRELLQEQLKLKKNLITNKPWIIFII